MILPAVEFIRRFLQHVLPDRFVRIRHYGFLSNSVRREKLVLVRRLLGSRALFPDAPPTPGECLPPETESDPPGPLCPMCGKGRLVAAELISRVSTDPFLPPVLMDTS
jgi:hypothetical protein